MKILKITSTVVGMIVLTILFFWLMAFCGEIGSHTHDPFTISWTLVGAVIGFFGGMFSLGGGSFLIYLIIEDEL